MLRVNRDMTVEEMTDTTGESARTIKRVLSSLKTKGLIERVGSNRAGRWKVL